MMEKESFDRIYQANYRLAFKVAFDIIKDANLAEDICQDIFIKMYQSFQQADEGLIRAWVSLNAKRRAIDYYRRAIAAPELWEGTETLAGRESADGMPEMVLFQIQGTELRNRVLHRLQEKNSVWYELMVRVVILDEDPQQVAREYNLTVAHMRTTIHRARRWIRKVFGEEYKELG